MLFLPFLNIAFCLVTSLLLVPFLSVSPPIECLSDKGCDYIDLVQGQTPSPPVCLSVGMSLCPFLSLFPFPSWSHCLSFTFLFLFLDIHVLVFFFSPFLHFPYSLLLSPFSPFPSIIEKSVTTQDAAGVNVTVRRLCEHMQTGRKQRNPLFRKVGTKNVRRCVTNRRLPSI